MLTIVVGISLASSAISENGSVDNCCDCLQEISYTCVASCQCSLCYLLMILINFLSIISPRSYVWCMPMFVTWYYVLYVDF